MLVWIFLVILIVSVFGAFAWAISGEPDGIPLGFGLVFVVNAIPVMIFAVSVESHVSDLSIVRQGYRVVEVKQQAIKDIDDQIRDLNIPKMGLLNADTPYKSLVEAKVKFVQELSDARTNIAEAKIDIESRSIGIMSGVVTIYGRE